MEEKTLVLQESEMCVRPVRMGQRRSKRIGLQGLAPAGTGVAMDHGVERQGRADDDGTEAAAQEAGGIVVPVELPPQVMTVIDVLERREAEPDAAAENEGHGDQPSRLKRFGEDSCSSVKSRAVG